MRLIVPFSSGLFKARTPWLDIAAIDLTALGSVTPVVIFSAFSLVVLIALRARMGARQLLIASVGAGIDAAHKEYRRKVPARSHTSPRSGFRVLVPERAFSLNQAPVRHHRNDRWPARASSSREMSDLSVHVVRTDHGWDVTCISRGALPNRRRQRHFTRRRSRAAERWILQAA